MVWDGWMWSATAAATLIVLAGMMLWNASIPPKSARIPALARVSRRKGRTRGL